MYIQIESTYKKIGKNILSISVNIIFSHVTVLTKQVKKKKLCVKGFKKVC